MTIHVSIINEGSSPSETINNLPPKEFVIHNFSSESEFLAYAASIEPGVIIINTSTPDKTLDYVFIRNLSQAPILVLSNIIKPGIVEKVLDWGADEYLLKPISPTLLKSRLRALARRSHHVDYLSNSPRST